MSIRILIIIGGCFCVLLIITAGLYLYMQDKRSYQPPSEIDAVSSSQHKGHPQQNSVSKGQPFNTLETPAEFYQVIIDNNIFRPLGWKPPKEEPEYTLIGTAIASKGADTKAFIVERRSGQLHIVQVDDQIGAARVKVIKAKRVILQAGDKEIILEGEQLQFF